jgi:Fic-DOC domain mobile mystery protein B
MTDPLVEEIDGSTPLTGEEQEQLIPSYITLRHELNEAEQANILEVEEWAFSRKRDVLSERFLDNLHKRMFERVWRWAGEHRQSNKTVGINAYRIPTEFRQLLDNCRYWMDNDTYEPDEIAVRFHHRLVWIHPYPNGNGRHARLATDLLLEALNRSRFSWGRVNLVDASETRNTYIAALRAADNNDISPLLEFVRT